MSVSKFTTLVLGRSGVEGRVSVEVVNLGSLNGKHTFLQISSKTIHVDGTSPSKSLGEAVVFRVPSHAQSLGTLFDLNSEMTRIDPLGNVYRDLIMKRAFSDVVGRRRSDGAKERSGGRHVGTEKRGRKSHWVDTVRVSREHAEAITGEGLRFHDQVADKHRIESSGRRCSIAAKVFAMFSCDLPIL